MCLSSGKIFLRLFNGLYRTEQNRTEQKYISRLIYYMHCLIKLYTATASVLHIHVSRCSTYYHLSDPDRICLKFKFSICILGYICVYALYQKSVRQCQISRKINIKCKNCSEVKVMTYFSRKTYNRRTW